MSDYIYGSSLRAAKSKANYLFEGDFRRRPNQNLSGASRSLARGELLQQAAQQRQNREDVRKREEASIKIQSVWRGHCFRKALTLSMRRKFDQMMSQYRTVAASGRSLDAIDLNLMTREFLIYYHSGVDDCRFRILIQFLMDYPEIIAEAKRCDPQGWLHRMRKIFKVNLRSFSRSSSDEILVHLLFYEQFTRLGESLDEPTASDLFFSLIEDGFYRVLRNTILSSQSDRSNRLIIELIRRSLDLSHVSVRGKSHLFPIVNFFEQFLEGPIDPSIDNLYFPKLLKIHPSGFSPKLILEGFSSMIREADKSNQLQVKRLIKTREDKVRESTSAIWLCYSFVRMLHSRIDVLTNDEKVSYLQILSSLLTPAEYITTLSLVEAANDDKLSEEQDLSYRDCDELDVGLLNRYHPETNVVITRLVTLINDSSHINSLKSIILGTLYNNQVQDAIVRICNLMLVHEPLAIFNCRLLYTVAFNRDSSRLLWKSIVTLPNKSIYGERGPLYLDITYGSNVDHESWNSFLPKLRLFCSLYSYLLPTLDDEEFYKSSDSIIRSEDSDSMIMDKGVSGIDGRQRGGSSTSFFTDRELADMSGILKNLCIGFIEILYQDRNAYIHSFTGLDNPSQNDSSKLLSYEMKMCFKALVRLVCQLHARDSRNRFCPDGHWICPSVIIPSDRAIDFQLVSNQQGRLLSNMTRDGKNLDFMAQTSNEIKTVLILQEIPFVIPFHDRVQILHELLQKERQTYRTEAFNFGLPGSAVYLRVRRNFIYEDAFEKLTNKNVTNLKLPMRISLINELGADEAGIDGGGLTKEFLRELLKAGFDPMRGFFKSTTDQLLYPNPSAKVLFASLPEGYEIHYEFLGQMLGKAIFEKIMVELPLAKFFLAKLLASKHTSDVDMHNLASLDPVLYKNLIYLKNYKGDVANLNLDFTISNNELDEHEVVELKPGGSKISVTRENKIEYVHLVADYRLNKQIRAQCAAFKRGLSQLIDIDWLRMFDPHELQILISGTPTPIDICDWRRNTRYANGYSDDCEAINTFWRVAEQFDEPQKRKLLKFATSCSLPPLLGFKDLVPQFTIAPSEETRLPTASTCLNLLKLPECEDEETMKSKLLYAIESNSGFELS